MFTLSKPLPIEDPPATGLLRCVEIAGLLDKPVVWRGGRGAPNYYRDGLRQQPHTCREYRTLRDAGWFAPTTVDMEMETELVWTCDPLFALLGATTPTRTHIPEDVLDPALLPASPEHPEASLAAAAEKGAARDLRTERAPASLRYLSDCDPHYIPSALFPQEWRFAEGCGWEILETEFGRADLNGDGYEDVIINHYSRRVAASMRGSGNMLLQRTAPTGTYRTTSLR